MKKSNKLKLKFLRRALVCLAMAIATTFFVSTVAMLDLSWASLTDVEACLREAGGNVESCRSGFSWDAVSIASLTWAFTQAARVTVPVLGIVYGFAWAEIRRRRYAPLPPKTMRAEALEALCLPNPDLQLEAFSKVLSEYRYVRED